MDFRKRSHDYVSLDIEIIIKKYCEQLHDHIFENLNKMDKFLKRC